MGFVHYKKIVSIVDIIFHIVSGRSSSGTETEGWVYSHKYNVCEYDMHLFFSSLFITRQNEYVVH